MKYYILPLVLALSGVTSSCSKFLEESSQSELVPRSAQSLNELLLGSGYIDKGIGMIPGLDFLCDDITMAKHSERSVTYELYSWQSEAVNVNEYGLSRAWGVAYAFIQICNTVLDYLPKVSGEQQYKDYVAGQAHLLRAYYYFRLVNLYGLPYNDKLTDPGSNPAVPLLIKGGLNREMQARNSVKEVYTQIEADLLEGIRLIEQSGQQHSKYRIGAEAGHLLASRMYLYMEKWDEVIKHTNPLLEGAYTLMDLRTWGPADQMQNPVIKITNPETIWLFGAQKDNFQVSGVENGNATGNPYVFSPEFIQTFEAGDLRNGIYTDGAKTLKNPPSFFVTDYGQALRLSEAYLNGAEALAQLYKKGNAQAGQQCIDLLNKLREKRFSADKYVPLTGMTIGTDLLTFVREERRRELIAEENHRWFDLRRYGMPQIEHIYHSTASSTERYVLNERDPAYLLPIPNKAIELNPKLVQNPLAPRRQPK